MFSDKIAFSPMSICVLLDFSLTVKAATLIFISERKGNQDLFIIW